MAADKLLQVDSISENFNGNLLERLEAENWTIRSN
jgi:hypothetical protein